MNFSDVVPLLACEGISWGNALHIFREKNVREVVEVHECHSSNLLRCAAEGDTNRFSKYREDLFSDSFIGLFLVPVIIVKCIRIEAAAGLYVVIRCRLAEITKYWHGHVSIQECSFLSQILPQGASQPHRRRF